MVQRLLVLGLLHHAPEVRRAAVGACHAVTAAEPQLMGQLLAALRTWANTPAEALVLVVSKGCAGTWGALLEPGVLCWGHAVAC